MHCESWPAARPFRINGREWLTFDSVVVEVSDNGFIGRGEALGVYYLGETPASMVAQIESAAPRLTAEPDRMLLQRLLPPGGARNALDCALWDLEAKISGSGIWRLTQTAATARETVYTIGIEATPELMAEHAAESERYSLLKVKLDGFMPLERLSAIRRVRPNARIIVDANQGWTFDQLKRLAPLFADMGIQMIEQPLARGADGVLERYQSPVPLCADESCLHLGELEVAAQRYQLINVKLDKCGGLTHALQLAHAARDRGLRLMVGCMGGTSLAMAPAFVVGGLAEFLDIDGPLLLRRDRLTGMTYTNGQVEAPAAELWG